MRPRPSVFIDPYSLPHLARLESFDRQFLAERTKDRHFDDLLGPRKVCEGKRIDNNANRPHSTEEDFSPIEFKAKWTTETPQAKPRLVLLSDLRSTREGFANFSDLPDADLRAPSTRIENWSLDLKQDPSPGAPS